MSRYLDQNGLKVSQIDAAYPLMGPDGSSLGVPYVRQAIRFAAECGAPVINTDEGPKPPRTTVEEDHALMRYTLQEAALAAEPRGILIGLEPHQQHSKHPQGLDRIFSLVKSPAIGINFDTGNAYLCGQDPYTWLERAADRLVHLHAKDISTQQFDGRSRQDHRHSGRLRLRRWCDRLAANRRDLPHGPPRHRLRRRVRHRGTGGPVRQAPSGIDLIIGSGAGGTSLAEPATAWRSGVQAGSARRSDSRCELSGNLMQSTKAS